MSQTGAQSNVPGMPVQEFVPWPFEQALPQLAQFEAVPSWVSQPGCIAAGQSANPTSQAPWVHVPVPHEAAACGNAQGTSQSPQLVRVRTSRSQPLSAMPSQLFQPVVQAGLQPVERLHAVVP